MPRHFLKSVFALIWKRVSNHFHLGELMLANQPFDATETRGRFDVRVRADGGGISGQAGAIRLGIARALLELDENNRTILRGAGLLTRDAREVERKKYGQPGARKRFQFSKR